MGSFQYANSDKLSFPLIDAAGILPNRRLDAAGEVASAAGKHVLALGYDPAQAERGQLDYYDLCHFPREQADTGRDEWAFVTALVPLSQIAKHTDILHDVDGEIEFGSFRFRSQRSRAS